MLSRFHLIPERNGQTDRQTDKFAISISHVSMLMHDKNDCDHGFILRPETDSCSYAADTEIWHG